MSENLEQDFNCFIKTLALLDSPSPGERQPEPEADCQPAARASRRRDKHAAAQPIKVILRPDEATRTAERPCFYDAECVVSDRAYTARARYGVVGALSRILVAAGIPDAPLSVRQVGIPGDLRYRSFYREASMTIREGPTHPVHRTPWIDPAESLKRDQPVPYTAQNGGGMLKDDKQVPRRSQAKNSPMRARHPQDVLSPSEAG